MLTLRTRYLIVGALEDFKEFVGALEWLLPHFFRGASLSFDSTPNAFWALSTTHTKRTISSRVKEIIQTMAVNYAEELEFYETARRLFRQRWMDPPPSLRNLACPQ